MSYYNDYTEDNIERNTNARIPWKKILGQSLESLIKELSLNGFSDEAIFKYIMRRHSKTLYEIRDDVADLLRSNIGSTLSRFNRK